MASLQVNLSTGEVGMAGGGGYFSSNVAVSGVQIADANGDLTNITANTVFASNLNVTGDFVKVTQSAGASGSQPALTINQETSGDILQLQRSGAAKVTVLENGNLGIGTTNPLQLLHVTGSARVDGNAFIGDSATGDAHTILGSASVTYSGTSAALTVNQQGTGKLFEVQDAGTARMTILDGGFVGIGTATPQQALHVIGSATLSSNLVVSGNITATGLLTASNLRVLGDYVILDTISSNTEQMVITNDGTGPALKVTQTGANSIAEFYDDGNALAFKVANDGLIGIGTATPQAKLHVVGSVKATTSISSDTQFLGQAADTATTPSFSFAANPNTGVFQPAASNIAISTGGTERLRVLANGNVGIGTTSPSAQLSLYGTGQATISTYDTTQNTGGTLQVIDKNSAPGNGGAVLFGTYQGNFAAIKSVIANGTTNTIGHLGFFTRNAITDATLTNRVMITDIGNVGIGTTNPLAKLHVNGSQGVVENLFFGGSLVPMTPKSCLRSPFVYTGANQSFVVPSGITQIYFKMWGGGGGQGYRETATSDWNYYAPGGAGGFTHGIIQTTPGETLTVIVGGGGGGSFAAYLVRAFGGGGLANSNGNYSGNGGGRSAIRRNTTELATAGGGGGGGTSRSAGYGGRGNYGGAGGGNFGENGGSMYDGKFNLSGMGGAQVLTDATLHVNTVYTTSTCPGDAGTSGTALQGGDSTVHSSGGGGGYYGGGPGGYSEANTMGGAGGGSGYVGGCLRGETHTGFRDNVPFTCDPDYVSGIGVGANRNKSFTVGGNGRVVIYY